MKRFLKVRMKEIRAFLAMSEGSFIYGQIYFGITGRIKRTKGFTHCLGTPPGWVAGNGAAAAPSPYIITQSFVKSANC